MALKSSKCAKGHRMIASNLYVFANGKRKCKKCALANARAQQLRLRQKAS
jgi:hypothetical protein